MALFPILNPNPVIRTDLAGNIILENSPAASIGKLIWDDVGYEKSSFLQKIVSFLSKEQQKIHVEIFQEPSSYYSLYCMLLEENQQVNFYFNNITQLKENEQLLKEAKTRAESSDKAKEEFIANMSHEIRTPLHAITGLSKILRKSKLSEEDQKLVGHIARSGDHLHSLINNILDFTKISAGEFQINLTTFSFRHLIKQLNSILHNLASEKGLELIFDISPNIYELLIGDETCLRQVLLNLLSNALKFTESGSVSLSAMPISDSKNNQELEIKIIDTGIGMSDEFLNRIFDKFSQEDTSLGRKYGGTGLGMAITKKLIHLMGGSIMVSSQKNEGTTFCIRLPFEKNLQKIKLGDEEKRFNDKLNSKKILIVEDNDINLLVARTVLSYHGLTIFEAKNGLEAINHPEINKVDLIFMDLQMPEMDGFAATVHIRKNLGLKTPIIALTANAVKTEIDRCFELGMNDYVLKPFNEIHLLDVLSKNLNLTKHLVAATKEQNIAANELLNLDMLKQLSAGSNEFMLKIINMFLDHIPDTVNEIEKAFDSGDYEKTKALAHKIKATYIQFGIKKLEENIFLLNYFDIHSDTDLVKCKTAIVNLVDITAQVETELKKIAKEFL
jgi:signal transduction histidine kinase/AmiR/NasT family two-component response regulator